MVFIELKKEVLGEIGTVRFRLKEVSDEVDKTIKLINELKEQFKEESKARSAEIYNLIWEVHETKNNRISVYTQSQMWRFNSVGKEPATFGTHKYSKEPNFKTDTSKISNGGKRVDNMKASLDRNQISSDTGRLGTSDIVFKYDGNSWSTERKEFIKSSVPELHTRKTQDLTARLKMNYLRERGRKGLLSWLTII